MSRVYKLVPIPGTTDSLVILTGTAGGQSGDFEPAVISDPDNPDVVAAVKTSEPSNSEAGIVMRIAGGVDSSEKEYTPGSFGNTITAAGDTVVYTAPTGKGFVIHSAYAVPVLRGSEDPPVITIKIVNAANAVLSTPYVWAANSKRKKITCPVDAKIVVNLDIAARVAYTFDIEALP